MERNVKVYLTKEDMINSNIVFDPLIERHSTWLAVNPIQGCPNDCRYCFMKKNNMTKVKPYVIKEYDKVIEEITRNKYYTCNIPICYFSKTDIMATKSNIDYLLKFFELLYESEIYNPIVLVTKCFVSVEVINQLKKMQESGRTVVIYISYSGLDNTIEKGVNNKYAIDNFKNLYNAGIKIIHYFRPLIPQNSTEEIIDNIINNVCKYSKASVVTGLKVYKELASLYDFWEELSNIENADEYECIWPQNIERKLKKVALKYDYPIYQTNACALEYALGGYDKYGICNTEVCRSFNMCDKNMREICTTKNRYMTTGQIEEAFSDLGYFDVMYEIVDNILYVKNIVLSNEDICSLSGKIHMKINNTITNCDANRYWNNALNGSKQLFI